MLTPAESIATTEFPDVVWEPQPTVKTRVVRRRGVERPGLGLRQAVLPGRGRASIGMDFFPKIR
jgi:hypothetical protein